MPNQEHDTHFNYRTQHIGNVLVQIVWNDSGAPYCFNTLLTQFQFVNAIEPHPLRAASTFSNARCVHPQVIVLEPDIVNLPRCTQGWTW